MGLNRFLVLVSFDIKNATQPDPLCGHYLDRWQEEGDKSATVESTLCFLNVSM